MLSNTMISLSDAMEGGISDPRNGIMLKIFSLIEFGERAGSGLSGICKRWEEVYHTPVTIEETHKDGVDRTVLSLSTGGHEQDVKAMLELYGDLIDFGEPQTDQETIQRAEETTQTTTQTDQETTLTEDHTTQTEIPRTTTVQEQIVEELKKDPNLSRKELAKIITSVTEDGIKYHLKNCKRRVSSDVLGLTLADIGRFLNDVYHNCLA